jgi:hypothetical protein
MFERLLSKFWQKVPARMRLWFIRSTTHVLQSLRAQSFLMKLAKYCCSNTFFEQAVAGACLVAFLNQVNNLSTLCGVS